MRLNARLPEELARKLEALEREWRELNEAGHTVAHLFRDAMSGEKKFNLAASIQMMLSAGT